MKIRTITELKKTCNQSPEQYDGLLNTGERIYMRARFGKAEIRIGSQEDWDNWTMETVAEIQDNNKFLGNFGPGVLAELFRKAAIQCDVDIDKLKTPEYKSVEEMFNASIAHGPDVNGHTVSTFDEDVIRGKLVISSTNPDEMIPVTKELLEEIGDYIKKKEN